MPNVISCPNCKKETYEGTAECPHCGHTLVAEASQREDELSQQQEQQVVYGGFWRRVGGTFVDGIVIDVPLFALNWISGGWIFLSTVKQTETGTYFEANLTSQGYVVVILVWWLYEAMLTSSKLRGTVGKLAVGLAVTDEQNARLTFARATGRHFAKYLSALLLCVGFLMVAFSDRKQGLHDRLVNTLVVKRI